MLEHFTNLRLCTLDPEQQRRHGYWYIVTTDTLSHTAFRTRAGLLLWLSERGLQLSVNLPEHKTWSVQDIVGHYFKEMHYSETWKVAVARFEALRPVLVSRTLSNGEYVVAKITRDDGGVRTVHTLNPNMPRQTFDYWESNALMDGDRTVAP